MPRLSRITPTDIPVHITQRGNNRQACFGCDEDYAAYAGWLKMYSKRYDVDIHAWVFMTNHIDLLCTPHRNYFSLGSNINERLQNYCNLFKSHIEEELLQEIRDNSQKGLAIGNNRFKDELETLTNRRCKAGKRGRPVGWHKQKGD